MQGVIGDMYVEQIEDEVWEDNGGRIRFIKPLAFGLMVRFDVVIIPEQREVKVKNVMFYQRGNKELEKQALVGDRA